jgi:hypothetical protein
MRQSKYFRRSRDPKIVTKFGFELAIASELLAADLSRHPMCYQACKPSAIAARDRALHKTYCSPNRSSVESLYCGHRMRNTKAILDRAIDRRFAAIRRIALNQVTIFTPWGNWS